VFAAFRSSISEGVKLGQVAIYCRVSTDDRCYERQERDLRAVAALRPHSPPSRRGKLVHAIRLAPVALILDIREEKSFSPMLMPS
jgi:hypothetical protein